MRPCIKTLGGDENIAIGHFAQYKNTYGELNVAMGSRALYSNTTGFYNTANGYQALFFNTKGYDNTANGHQALYSNTTGDWNTANGSYALLFNTTGYYNTANGYQALFSNTTGDHNTATGSEALYSNTTGYYNTANGYQVLYFNTSGDWNTANGYQALYSNTTGDINTAVGYSAHSTCDTCSNSTGIGYDADPSASNQVHVGNSSVTWIGGQVTWSTYSDRRIKKDVAEDVSGLDFITRLRPVTYHLDKDTEDRLTGTVDSSDYAEKYDIEAIKMSGFIAQEVEQAAQEAGYDFSGLTKPKGDNGLYSLSYAQFVVPLVKAVQEQQEVIQSLKNENHALQSKMNRLVVELEAIRATMEVASEKQNKD